MTVINHQLDQTPPSNQTLGALPLNSLGLPKKPADTRVVVAMSGGVDSSVAAALLKEQGYDVIGITLQLYDHGIAIQKKGACCAGQDIHDARMVADDLGIPHYVLDYESRFKDQVMEDFADAYARGETPIPCVKCNQTVKFKDLLKTAQDLGADCLATGHYIQRKAAADLSSGDNSSDADPLYSDSQSKAHLVRAVDDNRDQSYFLFATTQEQLEFLRFPLGGMPKTAVRNHAERFGLQVADKPDSQDICFVPNGNYVSVIERLRPGAAEPGNIVNLDGEILGQHGGIIRYTIGQRRGLGVGGMDDPFYVVKLRPANREVVVGPKSALACKSLIVKDLNWIGDDIPQEGLSVCVKIRSTRPGVTATLICADISLNTATILFDEAEHGVSPGQAAVIYDGPRVLGGGWIDKTVSADPRVE